MRNIDILLKQAQRKASQWEAFTIPEQESFLKAVIQRVIIHADSIEIRLNGSALFDILPEKPINGFPQDRKASNCREPRLLTLSCPFQPSRHGKEMRLILGKSQSENARSTTAIIHAIARAWLWYEQLVSGDVTGIPDLASRHGVSPRHAKIIFRYVSMRT